MSNTAYIVSETFRKLNPKWSQLAGLGENRLLRSSYIWLLLVPIAARVLESLENPIELSGVGKGLILNISLPFSWKMFFCAAILVSIANAIFIWRRPWFTKYENYGRFKQLGQTTDHIEQHLHRISEQPTTMKKLITRNPSPSGDLFRLQRHENAPEQLALNEWVFTKGNEHDGPALAFWAIIDVEDRKHPMSRLLCFLLYLAGLLLILGIMVQNIMFVLDVNNLLY